MTAHIEWYHGGEATLLAASADAVRLRSSVPSPPGSRIEGTLIDDSRAAVRIKIHTCKRQEDGAFLLDGKPLDLTREVRARLQTMAEAPVK